MRGGRGPRGRRGKRGQRGRAGRKPAAPGRERRRGPRAGKFPGEWRSPRAPRRPAPMAGCPGRGGTRCRLPPAPVAVPGRRGARPPRAAGPDPPAAATRRRAGSAARRPGRCPEPGARMLPRVCRPLGTCTPQSPQRVSSCARNYALLQAAWTMSLFFGFSLRAQDLPDIPSSPYSLALFTCVCASSPVPTFAHIKNVPDSVTADAVLDEYGTST